MKQMSPVALGEEIAPVAAGATAAGSAAAVMAKPCGTFRATPGRSFNGLEMPLTTCNSVNGTLCARATL